MRDRSVLVIGGSGQVGQQLVRSLVTRGRPVTGTYSRHAASGLVHLDSSDPAEVMRVMRHFDPTVVINAMNAPGGADACELDQQLARRAHFDGPRRLADAAHQHHARFVQISTDYVFDGAGGPYVETDLPRPLSRLGQAKFDLENYLLDQSPDVLIARTSFVFSWTPESSTRNFVMQLLDSARSQTPMKVPSDQIGNVTYAPNFADALAKLIDKEVAGLYHLAGTTRCSKYEWALKVVDAFGLDHSLIQAVPTADLTQRAARPLSSGFVLDKVRRVLDSTRLMTLDEGLSAMKAQMLSTETCK